MEKTTIAPQTSFSKTNYTQTGNVFDVLLLKITYYNLT